MKKYTQADFDALVRADDGYIHLPSGDWTAVNFGWISNLMFDNNCIFGNWCRFGVRCAFGDRCIFGDGCAFGDGCRFGNRCIFGDECSFGNWCRFGVRCAFGDGCRFGNWCIFGDGCAFGDGCRFSNRCIFGDKCVLENGAVENAVFFKVSNIGSRNDNAYAYCNTVTGEIFVRAGCWFSHIDEFEKRVHKVHAGTRYERDYIAFCDFARIRFKEYQRKGTKP